VVDIAAYRIVQEALTNTLRHAGPTTATVTIEQRNGQLRVQVDDPDPDPDPATPPAGHLTAHRPDRPGGLDRSDQEGSGQGITGMRERPAALGGTLHPARRTPPRRRLPRPGLPAPDSEPARGPDGGVAMIRVLLADDQPLVCAGLRVLLDTADDIDLVGEAATGAEALTLARSSRADVILMDIRMPELDGVAATAADDLAGVKVIILTTYETTNTSSPPCTPEHRGSCSKTPTPPTCSPGSAS